MGYYNRKIKQRKLAAIEADKSPEITDAAAQVIEQYNLDPALITGTGTGGRIIKKDVVSYIEQLQQTNTEEEE